MNRLNSAKTLGALFAAACTAKATDTKWFSAADPPRNASPPQIASGVNEDRQTYERKVLPPELSREVHTLTCESSAESGVCNVYVVGVTHFQPQSCQLVRDVIKFLKPEVVFLELCASRPNVIHDDVPEDERGESRIAFDEARKYGAMVVLGDRPIWITIERLRAWPMPKSSGSVNIKKMVNKVGQVNIPGAEPYELDKIRATRKSNVHLKKITEIERSEVDKISLVLQKVADLEPGYVEVMIDERDQYMSALLLKVARDHNSVVAVVGKAHLPGILNNWKKPIDAKQLLVTPTIMTDDRIQSCIGAAAIISSIYLSFKIGRRVLSRRIK